MKQLILINIEIFEEFKPFNYKAKLLRNTIAQPAPSQANGILKHATVAVPLKCLSNFWISLEMPLINCKFELKIRWTKHCVLSVLGNEYDTTLYVPVIPLLGKHNQKLSKLLIKGFE